MIYMARTFGAPESVPAGKVAASASNAREVGHLHRARPAHPAQVVTAEIDQHHVLGAFLRVGQQFGGERVVLLGRGPAPPGARDRVQQRAAYPAVLGADLEVRLR